MALVLGLVIRAAIFLQTADLGTVIVDEQHYARLASNVLDGFGFGWDATHLTSIRPPLYPGLLVTIWAGGAGLPEGAGVGVAMMIAPLLLVLNQFSLLGLLATPRISPTQAA